MLLESQATVLPDDTPVFTALNAWRKGDAILFEFLNVDGALPEGPTPALFTVNGGETSELQVRWPGLEPGLYNANELEVLSE